MRATKAFLECANPQNSMKPKNEKQNMVAQNERPQNVPHNAFRVQKPDELRPNEADKLAQEVENEQAELAAVEDGLAQRRAQLAEKAQFAQESARQHKLTEWRQKMDDAADYAEIARTSIDHERTKDYFRRSKMAEREAAYLAAELNLDVPMPAEEQVPKLHRLISTDKAIGVVLGLFLLFVVLTYIVGSPLEADPMNAIGQSIMKNAPIRALLSFTLTFLSFLVSVFFIRVAFPQFYRIWHNRIDTERSLDTLLQESPAWAVLLALLALFCVFMQLFASFYQALYA